MRTRLLDPRREFGLRLVEGRVTRDDLAGGRLLVRRASTAQVRSIDKKKRLVDVIASTSGVKRDGNAIVHSDKAWDFTNFAKNPAMLWSHDYGSAFAPPGLPLGHWTEWHIERIAGANALVMRGQFEDDEFPDKVFRRVISGTIRAVSIGWNPLEYEEMLDEESRQVGWLFTRNELYECSWTVIGADPDAGVRRGHERSGNGRRFVSPLSQVANDLAVVAGESRRALDEFALRRTRQSLDAVARDTTRLVAAVRRGSVERQLDRALDTITSMISARR